MFSFTCRVCFLCGLLFSFCDLRAQEKTGSVDFGLAFASHEVTKDQRTSLNLTPEGPIRIKDDFTLAFDLSYRRLTNAFGYIVRIIANDSLNIDLVSSPEHSEFYDLNLIVNNSPIQIHYDFNDIKLKPLTWNKVFIHISFSTNQISLSWNGDKKILDFPLNKLNDFRFLFGANDFGKFNTSDVPPVSLRNIQLVTHDNATTTWELKKHGSNSVYDTKFEKIATTKNPSWLIDQHVKWIHRKQIAIGKYPSAAFNSDEGALFLADISSLYKIDIQTGKIEKTIPGKGSIIPTDANQLVYVPGKNELLNYDVYTNKISTFNFKDRTWTNHDVTYSEPHYWHNNKFYNPVDSSLYSFGGYGFYLYNNTFYRYDSKAAKWIKVETATSIPPRYLSALGLTRDGKKALIFGGYGSKNGKQEISPESFYDLHSFDLKDHTIKEIWKESTTGASPNIVFSNSLVVNHNDSCFYVLSYPKDKYKSQLKLRSYSLSQPQRTELGDSIPFAFHDVHSFSDLFFSNATHELIAVTSHKEGDHYNVDVYSINYPPLNNSDILQVPPPGSSLAKQDYILIAALTIGILGLSYFIFRRVRKRIKTVVSPEVHKVTSIESKPVTSPPSIVVQVEPVEEKVSIIDLFGGFQVIDKSGTDITHKFTTTVKELFIFILLHSVKFEKGVSTTVLHEVLWPDKDEVNARNNRNVNLKKLRKALEDIGEIAIENTNSYVRLTLSDAIFCDYRNAYRILNSGKLDRQKIEILITYVRRGSLLPNMQTIWLDSFKSEISNRIIDVLLAYSSELDMYRDDKLLLEIADSIFNYDTINQEAMVIKCSVLNKKGKHSLAKNWYDHFAKEYMTLYGENYPKTFEEVIS